MALNLTSLPIGTLQALNPGLQKGANQIFTVGSNLYLVTREQIGTGTPSNAINVYKSAVIDPLNPTPTIAIWTLVASQAGTGPPIQTNNSQDCPACLVGDQIYIIGTKLTAPGPVCTLLIHHFDCSTDIFDVDSADGPVQGGAGQQLWSISAFNSGVLLISSTTTGPSAFTMQTYTPASDIWSAATTIRADASKIITQIHDTASDLAFLIYQRTTSQELRCATVTNALAFNDATVFTFGGSFTEIGTVGLPIISNGELVIPFRNFPFGPPELWAARATVSATPVFATETVQDGSGLPAGTFVQNFDQVANPGWAMVDIAGTLYAFYDVDNGESPQGAASASWLYYQSFELGAWTAPLIAFTSAIPGEQLVPYKASIPGLDPIILVGVIDPTLWDDISSLTNFIIFPVVPPIVLQRNRPMGGGGGIERQCCEFPQPKPTCYEEREFSDFDAHLAMIQSVFRGR